MSINPIEKEMRAELASILNHRIAKAGEDFKSCVVNKLKDELSLKNSEVFFNLVDKIISHTWEECVGTVLAECTQVNKIVLELRKGF